MEFNKGFDELKGYNNRLNTMSEKEYKKINQDM